LALDAHKDTFAITLASPERQGGINKKVIS